MATDRPIFLLGCPESGTALLRRILRTHPRIAIPPETRLLVEAYEHRDAYGDLRRIANRRALAEWIVAGAGTGFGRLGLDARAVADEIVAGPPTLGSALDIALRAYARRAGKPRWGDKRPGYVQHIDALLRMFPSAQIVHVIRDGRDCVAQLKLAPWWRMGTHHAIATWVQALDVDAEASRRLPSDAYLSLRYERLVSGAPDELQRLCGFLGEEYAFTSTGHPPGDAVGRKGLERWERNLCEAVMAERLAAHGYEPVPGARPPAHQLARYAAIAAHRRLAARKRAMLDVRLRRSESQPVASCVATGSLTVAE